MYSRLTIACSSIAFVLPFLVLRLVPASRDWRWIGGAYASVELLFTFYQQMCKWQAQKKWINPRLSTEERRTHWMRCMAATLSADDPVRYITSWFFCNNQLLNDRNLDLIKLGNMQELLSWALFDASSADELSTDEEHELAELIAITEATIATKSSGFRFPAGKSQSVKAVRHDLPIEPAWYPVLVYGLLMLAWMFNSARLGCRGFRYKQCGSVRYWIREAPRGVSALPPLVFCHGIGIGLITYDTFLQEVMDTPRRNQRSWIFLELPDRAHPTPVPFVQPDAFSRDVGMIIARHGCGHAQAHFLGQSIGTVFVTWIIRNAPHLVRSFSMLDPICSMLHCAEVTWNFVYAGTVVPRARPEENTALQWLLDFFTKRNLNVAFRIQRRFFWTYNELFFEHVPRGTPNLFVVEERDFLMRATAVRAYLENGPGSDRDGLVPARVLFLPGADHGDFVLDASYRVVVVNAIHSMVDGMDEGPSPAPWVTLG